MPALKDDTPTTENPLDDTKTTAITSHIPSNTPPKKPPKTTENPLLDTRGVCLSLNCGRWKIWRLCQDDPDFPNPRDIAGKNQWFASEIEAYKKSRPRRIYVAAVALLAVVSVTALSYANFFLA
jgi:predicted DNA-binding transcriptional regulator AlpA